MRLRTADPIASRKVRTASSADAGFPSRLPPDGYRTRCLPVWLP